MNFKESSAPSIQEIADILREANERGGGLGLVDALGRFAADQVTIRHHPPREHVDGVFTGAEWIEFERSVIEKVGTQTTEMRSVDQTVRVEGDSVVLEEVITGKAPDGTEFRIPSKMVLPVEGGRILGYDAYYDVSSVPSFMQDTESQVREGG